MRAHPGNRVSPLGICMGMTMAAMEALCAHMIPVMDDGWPPPCWL
jgi:hypothetical protein